MKTPRDFGLSEIQAQISDGHARLTRMLDQRIHQFIETSEELAIREGAEGALHLIGPEQMKKHGMMIEFRPSPDATPWPFENFFVWRRRYVLAYRFIVGQVADDITRSLVHEETLQCCALPREQWPAPLKEYLDNP